MISTNQIAYFKRSEVFLKMTKSFSIANQIAYFEHSAVFLKMTKSLSDPLCDSVNNGLTLFNLAICMILFHILASNLSSSVVLSNTQVGCSNSNSQGFQINVWTFWHF